MIKILLASHGNLAAGMLSSLELIMGVQNRVEVLCAYIEGEDNASPRIEAFINRILPEDDWIIFTDVFGGSINNEFLKYLHISNIHLVAGMSLPLVIAASAATITSDDINEIMEQIKLAVPDTVHFCEASELHDTVSADDEF